MHQIIGLEDVEQHLATNYFRGCTLQTGEVQLRDCVVNLWDQILLKVFFKMRYKAAIAAKKILFTYEKIFSKSRLRLSVNVWRQLLIHCPSACSPRICYLLPMYLGPFPLPYKLESRSFPNILFSHCSSKVNTSSMIKMADNVVLF
jgi:hypothetical protein